MKRPAAPAWARAGYRRVGARRIKCPHCGTVISSSALARASHERGDRCEDLVRAREEHERAFWEGLKKKG